MYFGTSKDHGTGRNIESSVFDIFISSQPIPNSALLTLPYTSPHFFADILRHQIYFRKQPCGASEFFKFLEME